MILLIHLLRLFACWFGATPSQPTLADIPADCDTVFRLPDREHDVRVKVAPGQTRRIGSNGMILPLPEDAPVLPLRRVG